MAEFKYGKIPKEIIESKTLSMKAIGLYCIINSYIGCNNAKPLNKNKLLEEILIDGDCALRSAWKELEEQGYIKTYRKPTEGHEAIYSYCLLTTPDKDTPCITYLKKEGRING